MSNPTIDVDTRPASEGGHVDVFANKSGGYPRIMGGMKFNGLAVMAFSNVSGRRGQNAGYREHANYDGNGATRYVSQDRIQYQGMVVQNYNISYQQNITKLRGLNVNHVYVVVVPPTGTVQLASALIGGKSYLDFLHDYGDACNVHNNLLHFAGGEACGQNPDSSDGTATNWSKPDVTLTGCLVSRIQFSQNIENLIYMLNCDIEFVAMNAVSDEGGYRQAARGENAAASAPGQPYVAGSGGGSGSGSGGGSGSGSGGGSGGGGEFPPGG